jgi:hypothetical protein
MLSGNLGFHEYPFCIELLARLSGHNLADRVETAMFVEPA